MRGRDGDFQVLMSLACSWAAPMQLYTKPSQSFYQTSSSFSCVADFPVKALRYMVGGQWIVSPSRPAILRLYRMETESAF
ncbi:hypothetical protein KC361_g76 [Hortaea werneckii]|nr:hypothetical protein KC361_g76 [Hortaea werneckii]